MTLTILTPPAESVAALTPMLAPTVSPHANELRAFTANTAPHELTLPMPVYVVGLDSIVAQRGLADAKLASWRYIIDKGVGKKVAAEVGFDHATARHQFSSLNEGSFADDTPVRVHAAQQLPAVVAGDYELRLLRIPALYVVALWLVDKQGHADRIVPLAPSPPPLSPGHAYTIGELEAQLAPQAASKLQFDDRPQS